MSMFFRVNSDICVSNPYKKIKAEMKKEVEQMQILNSSSSGSDKDGNDEDSSNDISYSDYSADYSDSVDWCGWNS
jgi:hypothetical protein